MVGVVGFVINFAFRIGSVSWLVMLLSVRVVLPYSVCVFSRHAKLTLGVCDNVSFVCCSSRLVWLWISTLSRCWEKRSLIVM